MNKLKILFPLLTLAFLSCKSQDNQFVTLDNLSSEFEVPSFFDQKIKQTEETIATNPKRKSKKGYSKILDQPFFRKDTLGFYKTNGRFPTDLSLEATNAWMSRKKKPTEIVGYAYKTVVYNQDKDTLAMLNSVPFPMLNMTGDKNGNLMYLTVNKTSKISAETKKIEEYLAQNCTSVTTDNDDPDFSYWENENFYYSLEKKEERLYSYDAQGNKSTEWIDITEIDLSIYKKSYIKKMESLNIYSPGYLFWKERVW